MSKGIMSYPEHQRQIVIDRRVRQYNPKGPNGCGVLGAMDYFTRRLGKKPPQVTLSDGRSVDDIEEPAIPPKFQGPTFQPLKKGGKHHE